MVSSQLAAIIRLEFKLPCVMEASSLSRTVWHSTPGERSVHAMAAKSSKRIKSATDFGQKSQNLRSRFAWNFLDRIETALAGIASIIDEPRQSLGSLFHEILEDAERSADDGPACRRVIVDLARPHIEIRSMLAQSLRCFQEIIPGRKVQWSRIIVTTAKVRRCTSIDQQLNDISTIGDRGCMQWSGAITHHECENVVHIMLGTGWKERLVDKSRLPIGSFVDRLGDVLFTSRKNGRKQIDACSFVKEMNGNFGAFEAKVLSRRAKVIDASPSIGAPRASSTSATSVDAAK